MTVWVVIQETYYNEIILIGVYKDLQKAYYESYNSLTYENGYLMGKIVSQGWDNTQTTLTVELVNDDDERMILTIEKTEPI